MRIRRTGGILGLLGVLAACQEGLEPPTSEAPESAALSSAAAGTAYPGWTSGRSLSPAAISILVNESGKIAFTQDAAVTAGTTGTATLVKTAGATVRRCFLSSTIVFFQTISDGDITIDGAGVSFTESASNGLAGFNYFGEVTALVKPKFDGSPAGSVNFAIGEPANKTGFLHGSILSCVLNDPSQPTENTVLILFGHQDPAGDEFQITHPVPVVPAGLVFDMALGISHSQQDANAQVSIVDVNGHRLTSCAGDDDDGPGGLLTVGGTGDTNANPPPNCTAPPSGPDDELYNLVPFVSPGETQTRIETQNPTNDDSIFLVSFFINRDVGFGPPECSDGVDNDGDGQVDFPADPGCSSADDDDETDAPPPPECSDGVDNDGDGETDFPADPGCSSDDDDDESDDPPPPGDGACADHSRSSSGVFHVGNLVFGTGGDDVIIGTDAKEIIMGLTGDDLICGGGGNDVINGSYGDDRIFAGAGNDMVTGGPGADQLFGEAGKDNLDGGGALGSIPAPPDEPGDVCVGGEGRDRFRNCEATTQ